MTTLYEINNGELLEIRSQTLPREEMLENWIVNNPSIIGLDLLLIGQQITTDFNGRIDVLFIDREGDLTILELKRDRTPRNIIAQILDYASWISNLTTKRVHEIFQKKNPDKRLEIAFLEHFDAPLPEILNGSHNMMIIASEFDASSKRIVEYLGQEYGVSINTAFFKVFENNDQQLLATDWLMDQQEVKERTENTRKHPWTGYYYINAGDVIDVRSWEDMRTFGFIAAGYGRFYSKRLDQLEKGDPIYAYQKGAGYVGYGIVQSESVMSKEFAFLDGRTMDEVDLQRSEILHHSDDPELTDYIVGVNWKKTVPISEAHTFTGVFANQNIVCKLRDPATLEFLKKIFGNND